MTIARLAAPTAALTPAVIPSERVSATRDLLLLFIATLLANSPHAVILSAAKDLLLFLMPSPPAPFR
jgi:hypothetical protein